MNVNNGALKNMEMITTNSKNEKKGRKEEGKGSK
jgi:hypothetical protein